jgi:DNA-binding NarL/FixJ family response regulator
MAVRVVIADDDPLMRAEFVTLLSAQTGIDVVGEAADGAECVRLVRRLTPDVVLMDVRMPVSDGIAATAQITSAPELADVQIVMLTAFDDGDVVFEALRSGACGFLVKYSAAAEVVRAVRVAASGGSVLSPGPARLVVERFAEQNRPPENLDLVESLTQREREVMLLVAEGLTNSEIGKRLFISPATARTHVGRILAKLKAPDRSRLVAIAYQSGMIEPRRAR